MRFGVGRVSVVVVVAFGLVHATEPGRVTAPAVAQTKPAATKEPAKRSDATGARRSAPGALPPNVVETREAILAAAVQGDLDELRVAMQWNELPPDVGAPTGTDPLAHLKAISTDGNGREPMAAMANVLSVAPVAVPGGRDIENGRLFVWPHLAEKSLKTLTPAEVIELYRLVPPAEARAMQESGRYTGWRLVIGADGTWHSFRKN